LRWYNPKSRSSETVTAPRTDEEVERMLRGHRDSRAFLTRLEELRADGMPVEQADDLRRPPRQDAAPGVPAGPVADEIPRGGVIPSRGIIGFNTALHRTGAVRTSENPVRTTFEAQAFHAPG
jgi:hypothetical protein